MILFQQALGVVVILCALYILKDTIPKIEKYPPWVSKSIFILIFVGTLWGVLSIVSTLDFITASNPYRMLLLTMRTSLLGAMVGICIVLGLAGYIGSEASRKGRLSNRDN